MTSPKKKVVVNPDACIGCGICASIAPEVFKMNEEGKSEVINPDGANATEAVAACPVGAITME